MYRVRVWYDERDGGKTFGDFKTVTSAEDCLIALAGRDDVKRAQIEEVPDGDDV
jgi:hypothetical protein